MSAAADIVEYAMQVARAGVAATLAIAIGTTPTAAARVGIYADLTGAAERLSVVVGGIDGAQFRRSGSDVLIVAQAGTRDGIALAPRGGGSSSYLHTQTTAALTGSHTVTWPDATGIPAISAAALTSGRVPYVTTGGLLIDSSALTYNGTTLLTLGADATSAPSLNVNGAVSYRVLRFRTAGSTRWDIAANGVAEGGANAGTNFGLSAYDDAGALIDSPITIARAAAGLITLVRPLTTSGNITMTGAASKISAVSFAPTVTSGSEVLISFSSSVNPASSSTANMYTINTASNSNAACAQNLTATSNPAICGITATSAHFGSGTLSFGSASNFVAQARVGGGPILRLNAIVTQMNNLSSSLVTLANPVSVGAVTNTGSGTVTRAIGVLAERNTVGATNVGYLYGVSTSVTVGNWGFYNQTADNNHFGTGQTSIGITTFVGSEALRIAGGSAATAGATDILFGAGIIDMGVSLRYRGTQVVAARNTGWTAQTAGASKADLGAAPTVGAIASFCRSLYDALAGHGLVGT